MDNLTHTMVGACLGQAGLNRRTRLAAPALLIGANLPDLDILALFRGDDFQFAFRRGWTHGVLGVAVLPALLVVVILLVDRWSRWRTPQLNAVHVPSLLLCSYLATATHPLLDWFNTYGMRWLMPFNATWTYGDTLFIVDPWLWLALAFPLVVAARRGTGWWAVGGAVAAALMFTQIGVSKVAAGLWMIGALGIAVVRIRGPVRQPSTGIARAVLVGTAIYAALMFLAGVGSARVARRWFVDRGIETSDVMASPVPANPLARDVVGVARDGYHFARVTVAPRWEVQTAGPPMRSEEGPAVEAARHAPQLAGFMSWIRYPSFEVDPRAGGYRVNIRDARYVRGPFGGFGTAWVELDSARVVVDAGLNLR